MGVACASCDALSYALTPPKYPTQDCVGYELSAQNRYQDPVSIFYLYFVPEDVTTIVAEAS